MSESEINGQGQKPKLYWMAVASPVVIIVGFCTVVVMLVLERLIGLVLPALLIALGMCILLSSIPAGLIFGVIGFYRICKSQGKKSGRIHAALGILMALLILGSIYMRAKSSIEGKSFPQRTMQGTIGDAIRTYQVWDECEVSAKIIASAIKRYAEEKELDANLPAESDFEAIGVKPYQLYGFDFGKYGSPFTRDTIIKDSSFSFKVHSMNPLKYIITVVNEDLDPNIMTLDQDGVWTEKNE